MAEQQRKRPAPPQAPGQGFTQRAQTGEVKVKVQPVREVK